MKKFLPVLQVLIFILAACASATPIPATPIPSPTPMPVSSATSTLIPPLTIEEKVSKAEYATSTLKKQVLETYAKVYELEAKDIQLHVEYRTGDGQPYAFQVSDDGQPFFILDVDGRWKQVRLKDIVGISGGVEHLGSENRITSNFYEELNNISFSGDISWSRINNSPGVYDFSNFDKNVAEAKAEGMTIRGNAIMFPTASWAMPKWLQNSKYSKKELTKILIDHVTTVVEHGKELGVTEWVVVNEPYIAIDRENDIFYQAFGGYDYINIAFAAARRADLNATLIFNDTDNHATKGYLTKSTQQIIENLKQETVVGEDGVARPIIDAVGVEAHLPEWFGTPSHEDMVATLKSYGLPVVITELDFNLHDIQGSNEERFKIQADGYVRLIRAAIEAGTTDITFWSLSDGNNWLSTDQGISDADPGLFDKHGNPKMVYFEVLKILFSQLNYR